SSNRKRRKERKKRIEDEYNRETKECLLGEGISAGPKGIVAIRASMGAGDFKSKVGNGSGRSLLLKPTGHWVV
ncbi:hypothetical protein, partial [Bacteroides fragilis]|uniref:hypothetical protein n=5 Tax=Bacteroides fragilis TaxID=817 RepID=UPI0018424727|nr:hypothetical protein [Bacteroides fragilis]